ncbi:hypothetical protein HELRODRAFT_193526 [Helobdella robusta]|uniref:WSC domain-containing protein n=1 Tax=Helobdella robusta TaxID=6412 RepID=T1FV30_HELRO|nr:hypothetical protein HELRODRAFT_193526 [Helobdella robusta]ESN95499.1 hypothetical protein HELRODRAFT_193526 [Helobdella robusta]
MTSLNLITFVTCISYSVSEKFKPIFNSYGLRGCVVDAADERLVYSYDSLIKCVAMCSAMDGCVGSNYHRDTKTCQLFYDRTDVTIKHDSTNMCAFFEKKTSQIILHKELLSRYIGCFVDKMNTDPRDLTYYALYTNTMTISFCSHVCFGFNYSFFGLQSYRECYCSHSYGRYGVSDKCNFNCDGDQSEICGGPLANSVYTVCDRGMYGLNCNIKCPPGPQCLCNRLNGTLI